MGVILLLADSGDGWALQVEQTFLRRHQAVQRIESKSLVESLALNWRLDGSVHSAILSTALGSPQENSCAELLGVLVRTNLAALEIPDGFVAPGDRDYVQMEWSAALCGWLKALTCPVVNTIVPGRSANLPPSHGSVRMALGQAGFIASPQVLVSDSSRAMDWFDRWKRRAFLLPLGTGHGLQYLQGVGGHEVMAEAILAGPAILQPVPEGTRLRAFVVGNAVVGGVWRSAVQDRCLREAVLDATTLPPGLSQQCRKLARHLDLVFAQIDLVWGRDEVTFCQGVSSSPDYWSCSDALRGLLVRHLVAVLDHTQE